MLKENRPCMHTVGTEEGFQVDKPCGPNARYDVCRPDAQHRWLFRCASLAVERAERHGEITAWVLRAADDPAEALMLLRPTLDAAAMAAAAGDYKILLAGGSLRPDSMRIARDDASIRGGGGVGVMNSLAKKKSHLQSRDATINREHGGTEPLSALAQE